MAKNIILVFGGKNRFLLYYLLTKDGILHFFKFHYLSAFSTNSHSKNGNFRDDPIGNEAGK